MFAEKQAGRFEHGLKLQEVGDGRDAQRLDHSMGLVRSVKHLYSHAIPRH